mgnify:CR=1 FL=1
MPDRQFCDDTFAQIVIKHGSCGKPYRPANGTEGEYFEAAWCRDCQRKDAGEGCDIFFNSMLFNADEPEYPKELVYGDDGHPRCNGHQPMEVSDG